jgi:anti-sigma-K factor RskA
MAYSEDHIALAAEYALGTLDADERALVETMLIVDPGFLEIVQAWERKLAPLHQMVSPVDPPAALRDRIKSAVALSAQPAPAASSEGGSEELPPADAVDPVAQEITSALDAASPPNVSPPSDAHPMEQDNNVGPAEQPIAPVAASAAKSSPAKGSGIFGIVMSAIAAVLAGIVALQLYRPAALPAALRMKPEIRTVEVKIPPPPVAAQWVAALQSDARDPGFILTVDAKSRRYTVRRVGPPPAAGKSYELWIVPSKFGTPHSIGVIDGEFTASNGLSGYDADAVNNSIYAVTVEDKGGSPSGKPTAQPLWAGKLYESVPSK